MFKEFLCNDAWVNFATEILEQKYKKNDVKRKGKIAEISYAKTTASTRRNYGRIQDSI